MTTLIESTDAAGNVVTQTSVILVTGETTFVTVAVSTVLGHGGTALNGPESQAATGFFSNTGAVAGTFVAVGMALAGLGIAGLFFVRRRKRRRILDEDLRVAAGGAGDGGAGTSRFHDDIEDDEFDGTSTPGQHSAFGKAPMMQQYAGPALPAGAAAAASNRDSYFGSSQSPTLVSRAPSKGQSQSSHGIASVLAGAAAGGAAGAAAKRYSANYSDVPQYSQAYEDQYAMAQQYTAQSERPYSDWGELYNPYLAPEGNSGSDPDGSASAEGSRESDPRRDSTSVLMNADQNYSEGSLINESRENSRQLRVANPSEEL